MTIITFNYYYYYYNYFFRKGGGGVLLDLCSSALFSSSWFSRLIPVSCLPSAFPLCSICPCLRLMDPPFSVTGLDLGPVCKMAEMSTAFLHLASDILIVRQFLESTFTCDSSSSVCSYLLYALSCRSNYLFVYPIPKFKTIQCRLVNGVNVWLNF